MSKGADKVMITEENVKAGFSQRLSYLRRSREITQLKLACDLNYSDKAVSKWERGESVPDVCTLLRLAEYFGVSVDYLLGKDEQPVEKNETGCCEKNTKKLETVLHTFIPLLSVICAFFVASLAFFVLKNLNVWNGWEPLAFLYGAAASAVVLVVFSHMWWKIPFRCISVSLLIWLLGLSAYFTVPLSEFKYIFLPCAILQTACIISYIFFWLIKKNRCKADNQ